MISYSFPILSPPLALDEDFESITNIVLKVPDEILALLSDPYIFSANGDLTTKEILRRFQERRGQISITEVNEVYNRQDNSSRPPPRRVETDPALWQGEASVRHVHETTTPYGVSPLGSAQPSQHGTPPTGGRWRGPSEPGPYTSQFNHSDSNLDSPENQRRDWRNSGWGRQGSGLGVSNNS